MAHIAVTRELPVPHERVWEAIADLGSHTDWMKDAEWIVFVHDQKRGKGTRMKVETVVGPFRTIDVMEVVGWEEGRSIEVVHKGLITGHGTLQATSQGAGTLVSWSETLVFPWWLGGRITAWLAQPFLATIWRGNLRRLEEGLLNSP